MLGQARRAPSIRPPASPAALRRAAAASAAPAHSCTPAERVAAAALELRPVFAAVDETTGENLRRVLAAFRAQRVGSHMFAGSTGYGHEDEGRLALDGLFASLVGAEAALVRPHFFSGTHTIACALYGTLRPGDELLALAGHPYDTLEEVIGLRGRSGDGSLAELGVRYREQPLAADGGLDWAALEAGVLRPETRCARAAPPFRNAFLHCAEWCSSSARAATRSGRR